MQKRIGLIAALALVIAVPHVALAGEKVEFGYKASELATAVTREMLLDRIEAVSFSSCRTSSAIAPRNAVERCAAHLRDQLVEAIADEDLTLLAQSGSRTEFRSASR